MIKLDKITISNFKVFQEPIDIKVDKKNLLILGENGSGKSSIYWALYTFFQSSEKENAEIQKYFKVYKDNDPSTYQTLRNINKNQTIDSYIDLSFIDENLSVSTFRISETQINTNDKLSPKNVVKEGNLASDFINYKHLHNFYNSTHRTDINLWQVFIRDFFPYFKKDNKTYLEILSEIIESYPEKLVSGKLSKSFKVYKNEIKLFNDEIELFIGLIAQESNAFFKKVFWDKPNTPVILLEYSSKLSMKIIKDYNRNILYNKYEELKIKLSLNLPGSDSTSTQSHRPHSFFNEAMLTRIALSIRFAALFKRLYVSEIKILVLDDMLISLDMSNRMKVIKSILNIDQVNYLEPFDEFQKIILTQDKGFFNIIKRYTSDSDNWLYYEVKRNEQDNLPPKIDEAKDYINKAEDYLKDKDYEACGHYLRKECESILQKYLDPNFNSLSDGKFKELSKMVSNAIEKINVNQKRDFTKVFNLGYEIDFIKKIETDFENDLTLSPEEKGRLRSLKKHLFEYLYEYHNFNDEGRKLLNQIKDILDRILNAASHSTTTPVYEAELEDAIEKMKRLKTFLSPLYNE
ncbi:MAG: AAA family ATPase [Melioribacteraceae bacterium]